MLAQLGFAVNSLFSMDSRPENIAEQRGYSLIFELVNGTCLISAN